MIFETQRKWASCKELGGKRADASAYWDLFNIIQKTNTCLWTLWVGTEPVPSELMVTQ